MVLQMSKRWIWKWDDVEQVFGSSHPVRNSTDKSVTLRHYCGLLANRLNRRDIDQEQLSTTEELILFAVSWESSALSFFEVASDYMSQHFRDRRGEQLIWIDIFDTCEPHSDHESMLHNLILSLNEINTRKSSISLHTVIVLPIWQDLDIFANPLAMTLVAMSENASLAVSAASSVDLVKVLSVDSSMVTALMTNHISVDPYKHPVYGNVQLSDFVSSIGEPGGEDVDEKNLLLRIQSVVLRALLQFIGESSLNELIQRNNPQLMGLLPSIQEDLRIRSETPNGPLIPIERDLTPENSFPPSTIVAGPSDILVELPNFDEPDPTFVQPAEDYRSDSSLSSSALPGPGPLPEEEELQARLQDVRQRHGPHHPATLAVVQDLASLYASSIRHDLADQFYDLYLQGIVALFGKAHNQTLQFLQNFTDFNLARREYHRAAGLYEELLQCQTAYYDGCLHPVMIFAAGELSNIFFTIKNREKSLHYGMLGAQWSAELYGTDHSITSLYRRNVHRLETFTQSSSSSSSSSSTSSSSSESLIPNHSEGMESSFPTSSPLLSSRIPTSGSTPSLLVDSSPSLLMVFPIAAIAGDETKEASSSTPPISSPSLLLHHPPALDIDLVPVVTSPLSTSDASPPSSHQGDDDV